MTIQHQKGIQRPVPGLTVSGLAQIATGAVTGFAYATAANRPDGLRRYGVQAPGRVRQPHLDCCSCRAGSAW
jgi:hypothetical protein